MPRKDERDEDRRTRSAARRAALLDHAREVLFSTELDGTILDANAAAVAALGIDVAPDRLEALLLCVSEADAGWVRRVLEAIAQTSSAELELHLRSPSGRVVWAVRAQFEKEAHAVLWSAAATNEEELTGLRRMLVDKTELLERERARSAMSDAANTAKDRLLAIVAEDTTASLNTVLGWSRMLRREVLDRAARDMALAVIEGNVDRHLTLLSELLNVAQLLDGEAPMDLERVDPGEVVEGAIATTAAFAGEKGVAVRATSGPLRGDATLLADREKLAQLVRAAIEGFVDGAVRGDVIDVEPLLRDAAFTIRVRANRRTPSRFPELRPPVGQDVGSFRASAELAFLLVERIARLHGGDVMESLESDGRVCLEIRFPRGETERARVASHVVRPLHGMRVLVFAPDDDLRELAKTQLRRNGASVLSAHEAATAAAAAAAFRPDVIVAEVEHGGMTTTPHVMITLPLEPDRLVHAVRAAASRDAPTDAHSP